MPTSIVESTAIVIRVPVEVLGPGSPYELRKIEFHKEHGRILEAASAIESIDSPEDEARAVEFGRLLQAAAKELERFFKEVKVQIDAIKNPVLADEHGAADPIEEEKERLGDLCTVWRQKQREIKEASDRAAREEAERLARESILERAVELEEFGEVEQAEALLQEPVENHVVQVQTRVATRASGQVSKTTYSATVTNLLELVKAIAAGKAPLQAIKANESYLNKKANLEKEGFSVPGCKLNRTEGTSFRT